MTRVALRPALLIGLTALAVLLGAGLALLMPAAPDAVRVLEPITPPRPLPAFSLRSAGGAFANDNMRGQWWLVALGYAGCPDVCPTTLAQLARVHRLMLGAGKTPPRVLFVSVDPARDTPQLLQSYVAYFSPSFTAVSDSPAQLRRFADALGGSFSVPEPAAQRAQGAAYAVGHSTAVLLIDPNGRLVARVSPPFSAQQLADALAITQAASP